MAILSMSDIRRDPALLTAGQHVVTRRGKQVAEVRVVAEAPRNPAKARAAFERLQKATANVKPSPRGGATAAVRRLRDGR